MAIILYTGQLIYEWMWVLSTLILLSPLLQGYCLYTLTTLSCFVCLLFVCTSTTMSYDLFVKLIGLHLLLIIALAKTQTSGCSSCRWRKRRRQRCRPSPQQRSPQVSPAGACPKFGASFLIFCFGKKRWQNQAKFKAKPCWPCLSGWPARPTRPSCRAGRGDPWLRNGMRNLSGELGPTLQI